MKRILEIKLLKNKTTQIKRKIVFDSKNLIIKGFSYSCGFTAGYLNNTVSSTSDKEIIFTKKLELEDISKLKNAKGIITTDNFTERSHKAILLRELQIPFLITNSDFPINYQYKNVILVTTNGKSVLLKKSLVKKKDQEYRIKNKEQYLSCSTKRGMSLFGKIGYEGVFVRGEYILLINSGGVHPLIFSQDEIKNIIYKELLFGLKRFSKVIYRLSDFTSNTLYRLKEGHRFEVLEDNPNMGLRGTSRLLSKHRKILIAELAAIKKILKSQYKTRISLLIPFFRTVDEVKKILRIVKNYLSNDIKIGLMIEIPSNITYATDLCKLCDFFGIGAEDLFQFLLAKDRDCPLIYEDEVLIKELERFFSMLRGKDKKIYTVSTSIYKKLNKKRIISNNKLILIKMVGI